MGEKNAPALRAYKKCRSLQYKTQFKKYGGGGGRTESRRRVIAQQLVHFFIYAPFEGF
jgi:hypothetical protein